MAGILWGVGVGPGDPELLTLKAVKVLANAPVVAYPANVAGHSQSRTIAAAHLRSDAVEISMPMDFAPDRVSANVAYDAGVAAIADHLEAGRDVAVLCEGDPLLYGSFAYVLERLEGRVEVRVVPGISALTACAAAAVRPIVLGDEPLVCLPGTLPEDDLRARLLTAPACAVFKVGRHLGKVAGVLRNVRLADQAVVVVRVGHPEQAILPLADAETTGVPYFSLILARRPRP